MVEQMDMVVVVLPSNPRTRDVNDAAAQAGGHGWCYTGGYTPS